MANFVLRALTDGIASIRLNSPASLNALDPGMAESLLEAIEWASASSARVIVLSGEGRAFCAGGNLRYMKDAADDLRPAVDGLIGPMHAAVLALASAPQPVLVAVHGAVAGAGMSLAMAADLAIAATDAVFSLAYVKIGATPDCSATWTLPRLVGLRRAMAISLLGDPIDAAAAERLGLVNRVVAVNELEAETLTLARRLADAPRLAIAGIKKLLRASEGCTLAEQLESERQSFLEASQTADFRAAITAFFTRT
jgi:2-(1,2-epoxy-1,2-dihydrophenyl)acetyl-CoA isomerase